VQVTERPAFSVPAGAGGGASDVRVVRPDGEEMVLAGAIVCPSDIATVAVIDADALEGYVPLTVSFSAGHSSGSGSLSYEWGLGDGITSMEPEVTRTFTETVEHVVTLTVTAEDGMSVLFVFDRTLDEGYEYLFYALDQLEAQEGAEVRRQLAPNAHYVVDALAAGPDLVVFDRRGEPILPGIADALVDWIEG